MGGSVDDGTRQQRGRHSLRASARQELVEALARVRKTDGRCVLVLAPEHARLVYGYDPEPGTKFLGLPMTVDPAIAPLRWELRRSLG